MNNPTAALAVLDQEREDCFEVLDSILDRVGSDQFAAWMEGLEHQAACLATVFGGDPLATLEAAVMAYGIKTYQARVCEKLISGEPTA